MKLARLPLPGDGRERESEQAELHQFLREILLKMQLLTQQVWERQRFCFSNWLPAGVDAVGLRTTLGVARSWRDGCHCSPKKEGKRC